MNSVIESMKVKGFTYLGVVEGEKIFCNLESEESISNCLEFLEKLTGEEWKTFKETTGNENLVFYRTLMFEVFYSYLRFKGDNKIELPLNCSSCFSMFENCNLSVDLFTDNKIDTSNLVDMCFMFYDCIMPEGFSLGDNFDTSSVKNMYGMFQNCKISEGFSLGDKFDTSNVEDMSYMFFDCKLPEGFSLGNKFDISNVVDMTSMFQNCSIPTCFSLGDKFNISKVEVMQYRYSMPQDCDISICPPLEEKVSTFKDKDLYNMFYQCELPEGKSDEDFKSEIEIIEWLKSRDKQGRDKQGTEKLSVF